MTYNLNIQNVPDYAYDYKYWIVYGDIELGDWFYGAYKTMGEALCAGKELGMPGSNYLIIENK